MSLCSEEAHVCLYSLHIESDNDYYFIEMERMKHCSNDWVGRLQANQELLGQLTCV